MIDHRIQDYIEEQWRNRTRIIVPPRTVQEMLMDSNEPLSPDVVDESIRHHQHRPDPFLEEMRLRFCGLIEESIAAHSPEITGVWWSPWCGWIGVSADCLTDDDEPDIEARSVEWPQEGF